MNVELVLMVAGLAVLAVVLALAFFEIRRMAELYERTLNVLQRLEEDWQKAHEHLQSVEDRERIR